MKCYRMFIEKMSKYITILKEQYMSTQKIASIAIFTIVFITVVGILFSKFAFNVCVLIVCTLGAIHRISNKKAAIEVDYINYNKLHYVRNNR